MANENESDAVIEAMQSQLDDVTTRAETAEKDKTELTAKLEKAKATPEKEALLAQIKDLTEKNTALASEKTTLAFQKDYPDIPISFLPPGLSLDEMKVKAEELKQWRGGKPPVPAVPSAGAPAGGTPPVPVPPASISPWTNAGGINPSTDVEAAAKAKAKDLELEKAKQEGNVGAVINGALDKFGLKNLIKK